MGHVAVFDPVVRSIYIHGGSKNLRWFSDVHVLNVDEMQWQCIKGWTSRRFGRRTMA